MRHHCAAEVAESAVAAGLAAAGRKLGTAHMLEDVLVDH